MSGIVSERALRQAQAAPQAAALASRILCSPSCVRNTFKAAVRARTAPCLIHSGCAPLQVSPAPTRSSVTLCRPLCT
jgi:hypothetical protein